MASRKLGATQNAPRPRKSLASPLGGFLEDGLGRAMGPAHGNRGNRRCRYYVSRASGQVEAAWRIPAADLEAMVGQGLRAFLDNPLRLSAELGDASSDGCSASPDHHHRRSQARRWRAFSFPPF
jgi:hypothetical protein